MLHFILWAIAIIYLASWGGMLLWAIKRTLAGSHRRAQQVYEKAELQRRLAIKGSPQERV